MKYEVTVQGLGILYYGEDRIKAETEYHMHTSKFGKERNVLLMNENEVIFSHDVRTELWRMRGQIAASEEKNCFYLHDGKEYQVCCFGNYNDVSEYTEAELQTMYAAWVAGWTSYHVG